MNNITIAIPTFERGQAVVSLLENLIKQENFCDTNILICDNNSQDGSLEMLRPYRNRKNITISQNPRNIGYQGNLLRIIEQCNTEYVVLLSDEDEIAITVLEEISDYLEKESVALLSPIMKIEDSCYRGKTKKKNIKLEEFFSSTFYISGLIYKVPVVREIISKLGRNEFLKLGQVYPQCLLTAGILASRGRAEWYAKTLVRKVHQLETRINEDTKGAKYHSLEGRATQFRLFEETFSTMINSKSLAQSEIDRWQKLRKHWMLSAVGYLRMGFANSYCKDISYFDKSLKRFLLPARIYRKLINIVKCKFSK